MKTREKAELRARAMELRQAATREERLEKSGRIMERLFRTEEFRRAKSVMLFCSKDGEVDTSLMLKGALALGKRVSVPVTDTKKGRLSLSELKDPGELGRGAFNVPEPRKEHLRRIEVGEVDLFIVPGLAFDEAGNRLGFGHAYFDGLLAGKRKGACCIGLAYEVQVFPGIPVEPHDVPMEKVITEVRVLEPRRKQKTKTL